MSGTAILCSGQGLQSAAIFDLVAETDAAEAVFAAAREVMGADPRTFVKTADEADLSANRAGQILCCTQALAAWSALVDLVPGPVLVAGYSVGELAAWSVAGLVDIKAVMRLAAERAAAMDAAQTKPAGLLSVRGLASAQLEAICAAHGVYIAIRNGADQFIVGGYDAALGGAAEAARARGAERIQRLSVHVASHTPLLREAVETFRKALETITLPVSVPDGVRLLSGIDGAPVFDVQDGATKLARQLGETVDWAACMDACAAFGADTVLELGPGDALCRMMRDVLPDASVQAVSGFRSLKGLRSWLEKRRSDRF